MPPNTDEFTYNPNNPYTEKASEHKENCELRRLLDRQTEYLAVYPNVCPACLGTGGVVHYEMVGDPAHGSMPIPDICSCLDAGNCPRCSGHVLEVAGVDSDYFRCDSCHWTDSPGCGAPDRAPIIEDAIEFLPCSCGARVEGMRQ